MSLDGCRAKLDRAGEHLETLDAETVAFIERKPYRVVRKYYAKTCHITWRFAEDEAPPLTRWGVLIGDVVHEVSSALDHIAWQFALKTRPKPSRSTAFPVCVHPGDWENKSTRGMLQHIGEDERTFIKRKQPYPALHGKTPEEHVFAMLKLLSRIDKHQVIPAAAVAPLDTDIEFINMRDIAAMRDFTVYDKPMKQGAKLARLFVEPSGPNPDVDMNLNLSLYITFAGPEYGHMEGSHVFTLLHALIRAMSLTIDEAEAHL
jgi:hypothetical protein